MMKTETPQSVPAEASPKSVPAPAPELFVSRELSWLEFNRRVLLESAEKSTPLFDRLKFISIYFSNLDEFFMVRIGSLSDQAHAAPGKRDEKTGMTAAEQIAASFLKVRELQTTARECWRAVRAEMRAGGIDFVDPENASDDEREALSRWFKDSLKLLLSPLVIDRHHPFPFLRNGEQYVVALLDGKGGKSALGIIPLGLLPALNVFETPDGRRKIAFTADVVRHFTRKIFSDRKVSETALCRVTRNADIPVDESLLEYSADGGAGDFREVMQAMLKKRRRLAVVRVQFRDAPSEDLEKAIREPLEVSASECVTEKMPLDFSFGFSLPAKLGNAPREFAPKPLPAIVPVEFRGNAAETIRGKDLLLAYPFHAMKPFVRLLEEAADDPDVLSVRISLYRMCSHSKIAMALARAAENGKEVLCVLELRARFDEQNNIDYAETLERAGCTVIYGLPDYKVHAKLCLITYRTPAGTRTITQIGTGNYNEKTSALYTDLSLVTADPAAGRDAAKIFNALGVGAFPRSLETLWCAPNAFLENVLSEIDAEIAARRAGSDDAGVAIKVNGLNNLAVMRKLVEASRAGVRVELFVRGICCLRPGVPGATDNVSVRSVVGTYLEHSRIFAFGKNARERVFIGSGDLLNRNLVRRVEVFTPVRDADARAEVLNILDTIRRDNRKAWEMLPDGSYRKPPTDAAALPPCDSQLALRAHFAEKAEAEKRAAAEPSRAPGAPVPPPPSRADAPRSRGFFARLFARKSA